MKKKYILIIGICLIVLSLIIVVFNIYGKNNNKDDNGLKYNKNESFLKEQTIEGVTFKNIECYYDGTDSMISYVISNKTEESINLSNYEVFVKDKRGTIITNIYVDFKRELASKEEMQYKNSIADVDLSDAYTMELKLNINKE